MIFPSCDSPTPAHTVPSNRLKGTLTTAASLLHLRVVAAWRAAHTTAMTQLVVLHNLDQNRGAAPPTKEPDSVRAIAELDDLFCVAFFMDLRPPSIHGLRCSSNANVRKTTHVPIHVDFCAAGPYELYLYTMKGIVDLPIAMYPCICDLDASEA